jgi:Carboxypeptidase regulatory-like domain
MNWLRHAVLTSLVSWPTIGIAQSRYEVVRGRVTDDSARAVRDANVVVTRTDDRVAKTAATDANGAFSVEWTDGRGDYAVAVSANGFQSITLHLVRAAGADSVLVANVRLQRAVRLGPVVTQARRVVPDRDAASYGAGGTEATTFVQNTARRLAPDQAGDITAIAAMLPGVALAQGGISVAGLPPSQNSVTMNGLAFAGTDVPRDAATRLRVLASTYDPSNGWFSGAQTALDLVVGGQFTQRTAHLTLDAPSLQYTDRISAQSGQRYTNMNASVGGSGQLLGDGWAYNYGIQGGRKSGDVASILTADDNLLEHAGVDPDSASSFVKTLAALGIPASGVGIPGGSIDQNVSFIGRIDHAPNDWTKRDYNPTTYGLQAYAKLSNVGAQGLSPIATPSHSGSSSNAIASLSGSLTSLVGASSLVDLKSGVTVVRSSMDPYLAVPDGRALVVSAFPGSGTDTSATTTPSTLQFGGNGSMHTEARAFRWETNAQLQMIPSDVPTHRVKLAADARFDDVARDVFSNQLGTFSYASLSDLAAGQPSSFTRTLTSPTQHAGEWNAFVSAGDLWRARPTLQLIYGVRADANVFATAPAFNPAVLDRFGLRTDAAPGSIDLSPRLGFTWQATPATTIRGGTGQFRNLVDPSLIAVPSASTGLPGMMRQVSCIGQATPIPNWRSYAADPSTIPTSCVGGNAPLVDAAPSVQAVDGDYRPQRSWRSNLGFASTVARNVVSVDGVFSLNGDQPGSFDDNFVRQARFTLSDEGRAVFVPPSSIDAASGALSPTAARADSSFGRVVRVVSDLRSVSKQAIVTWRPFIPDAARRFFGDVVASYTLSDIRASERGFDGAAFGDPTAKEWARGDLDARHLFVVQAVFRPFGDQRAMFFLSGRAQSGLPFTPMVSSDVNGDGLANDRAFIADSPALRSLIASSPTGVARCLSSQIGKPAGRNSCEGPWATQMNAGMHLGTEYLRNHRLDVTVNFANPLAGLDQLLHGSNLRGWGGPAIPDQTLYTVRGFDATQNRFIYEVNDRFGNTRPTSTTLRAPFRVTLDVGIDVAPALSDQLLDRWLRTGRAGQPGTKLSAAELARRFATTVPDPFAELLQQSDSLVLSAEEVKAVQAVDTRYRAHVDSAWASLGAYLAGLPEHYDASAASRRVDLLTDDLWEFSRAEVQRALGEILTPTQTAMLGGYAGLLFRARDRVHIRLTPRGG